MSPPFRRLCICDVCGHEEEGYAPRGWRKVGQSVMDLNGRELHNANALVCSDACEAVYQSETTKIRVAELQVGVGE